MIESFQQLVELGEGDIGEVWKHGLGVRRGREVRVKSAWVVRSELNERPMYLY